MSKGIITIPDYVKSQIDYLHLTYPDKEWSGILAYVTKGGDFSKLTDFQFEAVAVYPMDLGKASYTEFDYNEALADLYNVVEQYGLSIEDVKTGMIHSHHNMNAYFSGTDMDELRTNAKKHNYYLSLVVNVDEEYAAKVAFPTKVEIKEIHKILNDKGEYISIPKDRTGESYIMVDLDIEIDGIAMEDWFIERIDDLKKKNYKPAPTYGRSWNGKWGRSYDPSPPYEGRSWGPPRQQSLFTPSEEKIVLPPTKAEISDKDKLKMEDFILELATYAYGTSFVSLQAFVGKSLKERSLGIGEIQQKLDKSFDKLFTKYFGKKPSENAEAEEIVLHCVLMLDEIEGDHIAKGSDFEVNSLLDDFKLYLYEQVP